MAKVCTFGSVNSTNNTGLVAIDDVYVNKGKLFVTNINKYTQGLNNLFLF